MEEEPVATLRSYLIESHDCEFIFWKLSVTAPRDLVARRRSEVLSLRRIPEVACRVWDTSEDLIAAARAFDR